jgi:thymidylate synthase
MTPLWDLDEDFRFLVDDVLTNGTIRRCRNGQTTAVFGRMLRHDMRAGFPIITTRRVAWRGVFGELAAFLEGSTSLRRFKELGCNYWDMNAKEWPQHDGDYLGRIYGAQWRNFGGVDQLVQLVSGLVTDPHGRRHLLTTWNPGELGDMCLPPCHLTAQFFQSRQGLSCTVYMRSVDLCLGLPSDLVLYGLLLHLVAHEVHTTPHELVFMLGDAHVYENHIAAWNVQRARPQTDDPPALRLLGHGSLFNFDPNQATIVNYDPQEPIKYALN